GCAGSAGAGPRGRCAPQPAPRGRGQTTPGRAAAGAATPPPGSPTRPPPATPHPRRTEHAPVRAREPRHYLAAGPAPGRGAALRTERPRPPARRSTVSAAGRVAARYLRFPSVPP